MEEASVSSHFPEQIVSKDFQIVLMSFCAFLKKKLLILFICSASLLWDSDLASQDKEAA